jgi:endonuclease/exonuclease/phosphatase family metal-dependent hydrolase
MLDPWVSPENCETLLSEGKRALRTPGHARLASWNLHWFPDGVPGHARNESKGTDLRWLACVMAWLDVDAFALQEVKARADATQKMSELIGELERHTHARWSLRRDACGSQQGQHLAWLTATARVEVVDVIQHDSINPEGPECFHQLRPGLGLTLKFVGGLDLHVVNVHLKSGVTERDLSLRRRSWAALQEVMVQTSERLRDADLVVMGDFNSMGCTECPAPVPSESELGELERELLRGRLPTLRVELDRPCSHYYLRRPGLLDHVFVSQSMRELPAQARAEAQSYCRTLNCRPFTGKGPPAQQRLSDHCPIVFEVLDQDLD